MCRRIPPGVVLISTLALAGASAADEAPDLPKAELARRGSEVMAVVAVPGRPARFTAALCVHPSGLFVIFAEPFLHPSAMPDRVPLVLRPGRPDQSILEAKVLRHLRDPGLTLLRVDGAKGLSTLPPGAPDSIEELMDVAAFDVPSAASKASTDREYPEIHVAMGAISTTQKNAGRIERIQFDAPLSQGSAGGALVDAKGRLLGVILGRASADFGAGVGLAIPVNVLDRFLQGVDLTLKPPTLEAANLLRPVEFSAVVATFFPSDIPPEVELILDGGSEGQGRRFPMTLRDGAYRAKAPPFTTPPAPSMIRLEATFADGMASGLVEDRTLRIAGASPFRLHEVRRLATRPRAVATLGTGETLEGEKVAGLGEATMTIGGQAFSFDLAKARTITVKAPDDYPSLAYSAVALRDGRELGRRDETLYQEDRVSPCLEALREGRFIPPARGIVPTTYLSFEDQMGELLVPSAPVVFRADRVRVALAERGRIVQLDPRTGRGIGVTRSNAKRGVAVEAGDLKFTFEAPGSRSLVAGDYPEARGVDIKGEVPEFMVVIPEEEGRTVWQARQRGGNHVRFVVWELELEGDRVARLAIDFAGRCEGSDGYPFLRHFRGLIRYHSTFR